MAYRGFDEAWAARRGLKRPAGKAAPAPAGERSNRLPLLALRIPFPPTLNHDKRPDGRGGQLLTDDTKAFRAAVAALVLALRAPWVGGRVRVTITLYPPDGRAYDVDNRIKPTLDALQAAGVLVNDRQVRDVRALEGERAEGGAAQVVVEELAC